MEKGFAVFAEVYGAEAAEGTRQAMASGDAMTRTHIEWTMTWPFGSLWTRPGLERKQRSLAVLGMMIGGGHFEETKYHTKMGLANGLTRAEIEEVFLSAIPYLGFPAANKAKAAILAAFAELDDNNPSQ